MQTHDNEIPASSLPDRSGPDKTPDRMIDRTPEVMALREVSAFLEWKLRVMRMADEVKGLYIEKLQEYNRLLKTGKMAPKEYRESISEYEKANKAYDNLLSEARKTEAALREKYGEKYFSKA